jgi:hypothetical protein
MADGRQGSLVAGMDADLLRGQTTETQKENNTTKKTLRISKPSPKKKQGEKKARTPSGGHSRRCITSHVVDCIFDEGGREEWKTSRSEHDTSFVPSNAACTLLLRFWVLTAETDPGPVAADGGLVRLI